MKKTAIALTLTSLLALPLFVSSDAWAAPVRSLQKEQNYDQYISKRQVVDQLLADATRIFHSPPGSQMRASPPRCRATWSR